ncbi:MAG: hypothetical protein JWR85_1680 [Marmoricola sp.]|nr:hypothetical protein [Marmoricola sp.]
MPDFALMGVRLGPHDVIAPTGRAAGLTCLIGVLRNTEVVGFRARPGSAPVG